MSEEQLEDNKPQLSAEDEILKHLYKSEHVQQVLIRLREEILLDRAYMKLNFSSDTIYSAAAASSYALSRLHLIDKLIESGKVLESQSQ